MSVDTKSGSQWKSTQRKTTIRLFIWTFTWTLSCALATFGPRYLWGTEVAQLTMLSILLNMGLGVVMIRTFIVHLKSLDELDQKLQTDAMGIALGVSLVFGTAYGLLDSNSLLVKSDISVLLMVMGVSYIGAVVYGRIKML